MTALSILISDELAHDSSLIAKQMHISRSQFIRQAIENEVKSWRIKKEQSEMAAAFKAVKKHAGYLAETNEIEQLDTPFKDEEEF